MVNQTITIAHGDGIGPEIMKSVLDILKASGARLNYEEVELGEKAYLSGSTSGIHKDSWSTIRKNKILLKAPITTPQGGGYKSLNVTLRKSLGLFANVRPCRSFSPFILTKHSDMDVVIIRENEEDLYAGIEHQQTDEVVQCLKLFSRPGCEKIVRYAFEYARANNRKKVSCFVKDNIMKHTDGLFHDVFKEIAAEYPDIEADSWIIDIAAARLADTPEMFDVVVTPNLYGDVVSDIAAQISGSVGLGGSANIGHECAMFEAIHGSAPPIAGKNIANPSGLLHAAIMMLCHVEQYDVAEKIYNSWARVIEKGLHTEDIYKKDSSQQLLSTSEFAEAIINHLGESPEEIVKADFSDYKGIQIPKYQRKSNSSKKLKGVDIFVDWKGENPKTLAQQLSRLNNGIELTMITNRGVKVWPEGFDETFCTDHWRCRYEMINSDNEVEKTAIPRLFEKAISENIDIIKSENLYEFDGKRGYSLGQGQ